MNNDQRGVLQLFHVECDCDLGYDSYSAFVCAAYSEDEARHMHPSGSDKNWAHDSSWLPKDQLHRLDVVLIGTACYGVAEPRVIVASFHAG
jgi:hypothetical protein